MNEKHAFSKNIFYVQKTNEKCTKNTFLVTFDLNACKM